MPDDAWRELDDPALEALLVERWVYRGLMLGIVLLAAAATTYLGARGLAGLADRVMVGVLVALAVAGAAVAFFMRLEDIRIHRELRRRRASSPPGR